VGGVIVVRQTELNGTLLQLQLVVFNTPVLLVPTSRHARNYFVG